MAKRFIDSEIFRSPSVRALKAPYKLLWMYLLNDCDHAGIWVVDFDIASIYLDRKYTAKDSLEALKDKVVVIDGGLRWYMPSFVEFQYGQLNPENRAHKSVLDILRHFGLIENKPLTRPSQGRKDKDKDKVRIKTREAEEVYQLYPRKTDKGQAIKAIEKALKSIDADTLKEAVKAYSDATGKWPKEDRKYIPYPATWFNAMKWEDDRKEWIKADTTTFQHDDQRGLFQ